MHRTFLFNLFHLVGAAKLKDLSKKVFEQFLLSGGIHNNKSSLAEAYLLKLNCFSFSLIQTTYTGAEWSTKSIKR